MPFMTAGLRIATVSACLVLGLVHATAVLAQQPDAQAAPPAPGRGRGPQAVDPRVQIRTYRLAEPPIVALFARHSKPETR